MRRALFASGEATLQARCQFAGAGPRGRFEGEHRFKQRFQAMRDMRCFELFEWEAHLIFERGGSQTSATAGKWRFSGKREPERFA